MNTSVTSYFSLFKLLLLLFLQVHETSQESVFSPWASSVTHNLKSANTRYFFYPNITIFFILFFSLSFLFIYFFLTECQIKWCVFSPLMPQIEQSPASVTRGHSSADSFQVHGLIWLPITDNKCSRETGTHKHNMGKDIILLFPFIYNVLFPSPLNLITNG